MRQIARNMTMEGCGETVAICCTIAIRLLLSAIKLARRRSPSERRQAVPTRLLLPLGKVHGPVGSQAMLSKRQYPEQHPWPHRWLTNRIKVPIPGEAAPYSGMMPPTHSEMISPPVPR
jgi:hypothetical protein